MIVKLGGIRKDGRGRSFKHLFQYVLHDKNKASTNRRVSWAEPINCSSSSNVARAWFEMMLTWEHRCHLKRSAGIPLTGRDNERPVLHLTLSWHPDEQPPREDMMGAATAALAWLDLSEHQAIAVAHNDEPHPHVHIVVNTVHPVTGMTANLYQSKKSLSAWAAHWEEQHGGVIIESRASASQARKPLKPLPNPARLSFARAGTALPTPSNDNITTIKEAESTPRTLRTLFKRAARIVIVPLSKIFRRSYAIRSIPPPPPTPATNPQATHRPRARAPALRM